MQLLDDVFLQNASIVLHVLFELLDKHFVVFLIVEEEGRAHLARRCLLVGCAALDTGVELVLGELAAFPVLHFLFAP